MTIGTNYRSGSAKVATTGTGNNQERTAPLWPSVTSTSNRQCQLTIGTTNGNSKRTRRYGMCHCDHSCTTTRNKSPQIQRDHGQETSETWTVPLWPSSTNNKRNRQCLRSHRYDAKILQEITGVPLAYRKRMHYRNEV
jgi:hypothetical protein